MCLSKQARPKAKNILFQIVVFGAETWYRRQTAGEFSLGPIQHLLITFSQTKSFSSRADTGTPEVTTRHLDTCEWRWWSLWGRTASAYKPDFTQTCRVSSCCWGVCDVHGWIDCHLTHKTRQSRILVTGRNIVIFWVFYLMLCLVLARAMAADFQNHN